MPHPNRGSLGPQPVSGLIFCLPQVVKSHETPVKRPSLPGCFSFFSSRKEQRTATRLGTVIRDVKDAQTTIHETDKFTLNVGQLSHTMSDMLRGDW